jgi:branched-chain amino acid transport system permease protein
MTVAFVLQLIISGFLMGGVYSLIALGLSLIFGVMKVINFAHGEMMVWGMYIAYTILVLTGIDPFFSLVVSAGALFVLGYLLQRIVVNRIIEFPEAMQVIPMIGAALIFENGARLIWGPDYRSPASKFALSSVWIGEVMIDVPRLFAFLISILITGLVFLFLKYADIGKAIRSSADNRLGALLVGTDVNRVYAICFGIGAACVGAAGALLVPLMPFAPHSGPPFTMISFIIVILGGMGSLMGAMVGGLIVGIAESVATIFLPSSLKQIVSFSLMVFILLFRPKGLFGRS